MYRIGAFINMTFSLSHSAYTKVIIMAELKENRKTHSMKKAKKKH